MRKDSDHELPSVSVIVLNYNGLEHLEPCFRSLRELNYPADRLELMLMDNASTDGSVEFVRAQFPEVHVVQAECNYGFSKGNNLAAAQASGECVAFLNNDMRVHPRWIIELVRPLLDDPMVVGSGSKILTWDGQAIDFAGGGMNFYGFGYQLGWLSDKVDEFDAVQPLLFVCGGAMLVRRQEFLDAGGFDEDFFAYYEDLDLGWRLWVLGHRLVLAPRSITYHRHHGYWGQVANEKKRVLYERNAMLTMIKNYEEAYLQQLLPVAYQLLLERAYLSAGIDERLYRSCPAPDLPPDLVSPPAEAAPGAPPAPPRYDARYYLGQTLATLRRDGPVTLARRSRDEVRRRTEGRSWRRLFRAPRAQAQKDGTVNVPAQALAYLVAAHDVAVLQARMLEKRAWIQAHRRRSDRELFQLFGLPLEVSYFTTEYAAMQHYLVRLFGIDTLFEQSDDRP
ncbi:MAG: glycosyltransferase family 2 protein [Chloroflexi bacterium]|nr:glycosyltransferase family 2 protein [Chloroflexota bacterium]MBU1750007.1 glycosyltransferase family 2 protein [Chloroflexota bacterium]MBU1878863.1 glycosyltransferase family 2 protein [Chloroflexota bacterium]